jgi:predicted dienelactone hydrolase/ketosteroid isomerase-like protein
MNRLTLHALLCVLPAPAACAQQPSAEEDIQILTSLRQRIESAESVSDWEFISSNYHEDIVTVAPGMPPIVGADAVAALDRFLFDRFAYDNRYVSLEVDVHGDSAIDRGFVLQSMTPRAGGETVRDSLPYAFVYDRRRGSDWRLARARYGEVSPLGSRMPRLPEPTGPHTVGATDLHFTDMSRAETFTEDPDDHREVAAQVWYPALRPPGAPRTRRYREREVARAAARFLGWPLFFNSFYSLLGTHAYLDAEPDRAAQPYPVLIYNHGFSGFATVHTALLEDLASHGYVVVSVGHAYESALFIKPGGGVLVFDPQNDAYRARIAEATGDLQESIKDSVSLATNLAERERWYRELLRHSPLHQESTRIWTADVSFVIDRLVEMNAPGRFFAGLLDLGRIGVLGHSLGGAAAGQAVVTDARVTAGINMDGFQFGDVLDRGLSKPFMFMAADRPWAGEGNASTDIFYERSQAAAYLVYVRGFEHSSFTDQPLFQDVWADEPSGVDGERVLEIQREYVRAFFDRHLKGADARLLDGSSPDYPEVLIRSRRAR